MSKTFRKPPTPSGSSSPNVGTYNMRLYDGAYLLGVLAGRMSKTNVLGFLASFPIPAVFLTLDGYTLGALSVNPKIKTKVVWVSSWYDPAKERQAAETLISQGADCLAQITDSPAALIAAQEKGVYAFGWDTDMQKHGPKAHLTAATTDWSIFYIETTKKVMAGQWKSTRTLGGARDGWLQMSPLNPIVPPDVAKIYEERKAALASGKLEPFSGPIKDSTGALRVPAGKSLSDAELYQTNWYVEGVEGAPPK
jgi:basic membrane protein A